MICKNTNSTHYRDLQSCLLGEEIRVSSAQNIWLESRNRVYLLHVQKGVFSATVGNQSLILHPAHVMVLSANSSCMLSGNAGIIQIVSLSLSVCHSAEKTRVLMSSDIISALITEIVNLNYERRNVSRENALSSLLVCEMSRNAHVNGQLAMEMPTDKRLLGVCHDLLLSPSLHDNVNEWCRKAGMSRRNFSRIFKIETGMTFVEWRREVRLLVALSKIVSGAKITAAAYDVGYENVSTFTAAFSRRFGKSPGRYKSNVNLG